MLAGQSEGGRGRRAGLLLVFVVAACEVSNGPTSPAVPHAGSPTYLISDGAHGGNPHLYFLPPLVAAPSFSGAFDGTLTPTVEICELAGAACGTVVASFSGPEVKVDLVDEAYRVVWHTGESGLDESLDYRMEVLLENLVIGFADVDVVPNGSGTQSVSPDGVIVVRNGTARPIQFRIEQGVLDGVFASVEAGGLHSCGLTPSGQVYCWGANNAGQLGDGNAPAASDTPVAVAGDHVFQALSVGYVHNCALTSGGQAYCWGSNLEGSLGDGNGGVDSDTPVPVSGGHAFQSISVGGDHTCALTSVGDAYCWGENLYGGLGDGNAPADSDEPVLVLGGHVFTSISAGLVHTCAVASAGAGYCWGSNGKGRLGNGNADTDSHTPSLVSGGLLFQSISAGNGHSCGLAAGATIYCWGYGLYGQLGDGNAGADHDIPVLVLGGHSFESVDTGDEHTCGIVSGGDAYCWGNDGAGQLGDGGGPTNSDVPSLASGAHAFEAISAGMRHTCGLSPVGVARCWGTNQDGELGDGNAPFGSGVPIEVAFP